MKKILIEISSPAAGLAYDMFVPNTLRLGELAHLASEVFSRMSNGTYICSGTAIICRAESGEVLKPSETVKESEIKHGTKLLLF